MTISKNKLLRSQILPRFLIYDWALTMNSKKKKKVEKNQLLNDKELMQFIILPLSYRTKKEKQQKVCETVELAAKIQDKKQQIFTLAGILVFTDKVIDRETAGRIRRVIEMTQVAQIFEEEKQHF